MDNRTMIPETRQCKIVSPGTLNDHNTLFGGNAMQWMEEVAYIAAIRFIRKNVAIESIGKAKFLSPVKAGTFSEITGNIVKVSEDTVEVQVDLHTEEFFTGEKEKAIEVVFVYKIVDPELRSMTESSII